MILKNTLAYFQNLLSETNKKSEMKVYQEFIRILTALDQRDLSTEDRTAIDTELNTLDLISSTPRKKRFYKKALLQFEKYLLDTFSLSTKSYYTNRGIALGMTFGLLVGTVLLNNFERSMGISLGMAFGMFTGLLIGRHLDEKALAAGKII